MDREKHLELIQGVINRMASNSFQLKGWSVVLVSALFVVAGNYEKVYFACLAFLPAIAFWVLDGFFLWQEKMYRELYDAVRLDEGDTSDFSMKAYEYEGDVKSWPEVCRSKTLVIFHGTILVAVVIVTLRTLVAGW